MNKVVLIGRTTKEVDLRRTESGKAVASFTIAVDNRFVLKDGKPTTDFFNCVAWNNIAENMGKFVGKGSLIGVEGRLQTRNYDDKDGKKVYVTEVIADNVEFLQTKRDEQEQTQQESSNTSNDDFNITEDDLPF